MNLPQNRIICEHKNPYKCVCFFLGTKLFIEDFAVQISAYLRTCCILSKSKHGRCVRCDRWPRGGRRRGDTAQWKNFVGGLLLS